MTATTAAAGPVFQEDHAEGSIAAMHRAAESCRRCDLYRNATQVVFGEGNADARVVLIGEQPGDREDAAGRPFVGPAGRLLDVCLQEAGVDRADCYVTNAVKHFKFELRGKRRIHEKPNAGEVRRCAWWLGGEIDRLKPRLLVALGATAVFALFGRGVGVTKERGRILDAANGLPALVTIHPSFLLRIRTRPEAEQERHRFVEDLRRIKDFLHA